MIPHFIDWTIQHRDNPNWLLAWHCGNAPASLAADPTKSALRSRPNMTGEIEVTEGDLSAGLYQFQIKPGVVTFCRLQEYEDEWKMLIATGEIIPSDEDLAGTWSWVEVTDHEELYRTLVEEGLRPSRQHDPWRSDGRAARGVSLPGHRAGRGRVALCMTDKPQIVGLGLCHAGCADPHAGHAQLGTWRAL